VWSTGNASATIFL